MTSARNCCFTLNNWMEEEYDALLELECKYMVVGKEVGKNGTPHLQGYVEFNGPKRFSTLKGLFPRMHWEARRGTAKQAADYCKKDGDFYEVGEISAQGKRNDLVEVANLVNVGATMAEIAEYSPATYMRYHKGIAAYKFTQARHRLGPPNVVWLWGKAGVGKTSHVFELFSDIYIKDGTPWWDGYENQEVILIDDFDGKWPFRDLLRLLDRYPYQGQIKGGYVKINSPEIYITCEYPPEHFWAGNELAQVMRRVTHVTEVAGNTKQPLSEIENMFG